MLRGWRFIGLHFDGDVQHLYIYIESILCTWWDVWLLTHVLRCIWMRLVEHVLLSSHQQLSSLGSMPPLACFIGCWVNVDVDNCSFSLFSQSLEENGVVSPLCICWQQLVRIMARFNLKLCITGFNSRDYYVNIRKEMLASCRWPIWSGQDIYLTMKNNQVC